MLLRYPPLKMEMKSNILRSFDLQIVIAAGFPDFYGKCISVLYINFGIHSSFVHHMDITRTINFVNLIMVFTIDYNRIKLRCKNRIDHKRYGTP